MGNNDSEKIELIKKSFEFKNQKKYKQAIQMLYKVLEYNNELTDNIEILSQLGDLYILIESYDRALDKFQKILSLDKTHEHATQKCFEIYFKLKQYNKALKIANEMCETNKNAKSYYNYLKTLIVTDKKQDAIEIFNNLDEKIKLDTDVLYLIATISEEKKEIVLKKIIELDETHPEANIELATIEFNRKNYEKVISYCLNLVEDCPMSLYYLARIEAHRQNFSRAIELYIKAIELDNDEYDFYIDLAKAYIDISWYDESLSAIKKSINLSIVKNNYENLDEKYLLSAWVLIKQNKYQKALLNLNSINKNSKLYNNAQILLQVINLKKYNCAKVISNLENSIKEKENENNPILIDTLALAYKELHQTKKAIDIYKKGLKSNPNSIYYTLELIDLYIDDKEYNEALKLIEKFSETNKNCPSIYNSLARIFYRLKNLDEALRSIDEYLKLDKNNAESYYFKGLILNDMEKYEEAKNSIYNAIKLNPTSAKYYSQMARSYTETKEYENALLYCKEAIEIDNNEINYKKQAYDIACLIDDKEQIKNYKRQLNLSEKIKKIKK